MSSVGYPCGCVVHQSMFGAREIMGVHHCQDHKHLYSQDKTIRCMADEIAAHQVSP